MKDLEKKLKEAENELKEAKLMSDLMAKQFIEMSKNLRTLFSQLDKDLEDYINKMEGK